MQGLSEFPVKRALATTFLLLLAGCGRLNPLNPDVVWTDSGWVADSGGGERRPA